MEVSSTAQMKVFLLCVALGTAFGALFDLQRSFRKIHKASDVRTTIQDIVFTLIYVAFSIAVCYKFDEGRVRYYHVLGLISGMMIYASCLSGFVMRALDVIYTLLKKFVVKPIVFLLHLLIMPIVKIYG